MYAGCIKCSVLSSLFHSSWSIVLLLVFLKNNSIGGVMHPEEIKFRRHIWRMKKEYQCMLACQRVSFVLKNQWWSISIYIFINYTYTTVLHLDLSWGFLFFRIYSARMYVSLCLDHFQLCIFYMCYTWMACTCVLSNLRYCWTAVNLFSLNLASLDLTVIICSYR